jgi:hypothetical protein
MISKRLTVKLFVQDPESIRLEDFVPVFHGWIQEGTVEGLLIDVADYKHVPDGPGILLVGDPVDYAMDMGAGRPGLLVRRKYRGRPGQPIQGQLHESISLALRACRAIETDPALQGRVRFRTDEIEIAFPDRLAAANNAESLADISAVISSFFEQTIFKQTLDRAVQLQRVSTDARETFAVRVSVPGAPSLGLLIENLEEIRLAL